MIPNVFDPATTSTVLKRLEELSADTKPLWGKMNAAQMLAHLNVAYEMAFEEGHKQPGFLQRFILKSFVKPIVVGDKPYKKNSPTSSAFKQADQKEFDKEKQRLREYVQRVESLGTEYFNGKNSLSFGEMTSQEWSNMFQKHLDHHFAQFGI